MLGIQGWRPLQTVAWLIVLEVIYFDLNKPWEIDKDNSKLKNFRNNA